MRLIFLFFSPSWALFGFLFSRKQPAASTALSPPPSGGKNPSEFFNQFAQNPLATKKKRQTSEGRKSYSQRFPSSSSSSSSVGPVAKYVATIPDVAVDNELNRIVEIAQQNKNDEGPEAAEEFLDVVTAVWDKANEGEKRSLRQKVGLILLWKGEVLKEDSKEVCNFAMNHLQTVSQYPDELRDAVDKTYQPFNIAIESNDRCGERLCPGARMVLDLLLDSMVDLSLEQSDQLSQALRMLLNKCPAEIDYVSLSNNLIRGVLQVDPYDADSVDPLIESLEKFTIDETTVFSD